MGRLWFNMGLGEGMGVGVRDFMECLSSYGGAYVEEFYPHASNYLRQRRLACNN